MTRRIIAIEISGKGGRATVLVPADEWQRMSATARVLTLHAAARDVTRGLPFWVVRRFERQ